MGVIPHHIYRPHPTPGVGNHGGHLRIFTTTDISFVCSMLYTLIVYFIYSDIWFRVYIPFIVKSIKILWLYFILQLKLKRILVSSRASPKFSFFPKFLSCLFFHSNFRVNFSRNKTKIPSEF